MTVRFDQSLPFLVQTVRQEMGDEAARNAVFIRDGVGLLSVVFNQILGDEKLAKLEKSVKNAIGGYAREDATVRDSESIGAKILLKGASKQLDVGGFTIAFVDRRIVGADWLLSPAANLGVPRIAFTSVKGGVGRSTALAVLTAYLSWRGLRVLAIDLDLEAPGIGSMLLEADVLPKFGTLDYLVENGISGIDQEFLSDCTGKSFLGASGGQVTIFPAIGTSTIDNPATALSKISRAYLEDTTVTGDTISLTAQIAELVNRLAATAEYDVILIDGRAGLHETNAAVLLGLGAEILFFGVDEPQTYLGYRLLLSHLGRFIGDAYDEWWRRIQFVQAKAPEDPDLQHEAKRKFLDVVSSVRAERPNIAEIRDNGEKLTSDDFVMQWKDPSDDLSLDDIDKDEVPVIQILDDRRYQGFDPLRNGILLTHDIFKATFAGLLEWADSVVAELQKDSDAR